MDFWTELRMYAGAALAIVAAVLCGASFVHLEAGLMVLSLFGFLLSIGVALLFTGAMIILSVGVVEAIKEWIEDLAWSVAKRYWPRLCVRARELR